MHIHLRLAIGFALLTQSSLTFAVDASTSTQSKKQPIYKNPKASIEDRVKDLLPRMSLEEKVAQLIQGRDLWHDLFRVLTRSPLLR